MELTETDKAWLAGLIEGDGHIGIFVRSNGKARVRLAVEMADEDIVRRCHQLAGVGNVIPYDRKAGKWKRTYKWQVQATKEVLLVLEAIKPYVYSTRKRAELQAIIDHPNKSYR